MKFILCFFLSMIASILMICYGELRAVENPLFVLPLILVVSSVGIAWGLVSND